MTQEAGYFCQRNRTPFDLIRPGYHKNKTALKSTNKLVSRIDRVYYLAADVY